MTPRTCPSCDDNAARILQAAKVYAEAWEALHEWVGANGTPSLYDETVRGEHVRRVSAVVGAERRLKVAARGEAPA